MAAPRFVLRAKAVLLGGVSLACITAAAPAWSQACGTPTGVPATLNCAAATYNAGVNYQNANGLTLNFTNPATTIGGLGVLVRSTGTNTNDLAINATNFTSITPTTGLAASGGFRRGIDVRNSGTGGNVTVLLDGGGLISAFNGPGNRNDGVLAQSNASVTGDVLITLEDAQVRTFGNGLWSNHLGNGNAAVVMNGGSVATQGPGGVGGPTRGHALWSNHSGTGNATVVMNGGSVVSQGQNNAGLYANHNGTSGDATVQFNGGTIETRGTANPGVLALINNQNSNGVSRVTMTGGSIQTAIGTAGQSSGGLLSQNLGSGDAIATMSGGSIEVRGVNTSFFNPGGSNSRFTLRAAIVSSVGNGGTGIGAGNQNVNSTATALAVMTGGTISNGNQRGAHGVQATNWAMGDSRVEIGDTSGNTNNTIDITVRGPSTSGAQVNIQRSPIFPGGLPTQTGNSTIVITGENTNIAALGTDSSGAFNANGGEGEMRTTVQNGATVEGTTAGIRSNGRGRHFVTVNGPATSVSGTTGDGNGVLVEQVAGSILPPSPQTTPSFVVNIGGGATITAGSGATNTVAGSGIMTESLINHSGLIAVANGAVIDGSNGARGITDLAANTTIISAGTILNGISTGAGDDTITLENLSITTAGIEGGFGSDTAFLRSGSTVSGDLLMDQSVLPVLAGSDTLTIEGGADISGVTAIDGGDDVSEADGRVDVLHLAGGTRSFDGGDLTNWEVIELTTGSINTTGGTGPADITFSGNPLVSGLGAGAYTNSAGQTFGYGLNIRAGSTARFDGNFTLNANLHNEGTVDLTVDNAVSTRLDVVGDYNATAGSRLLIDVFLNDGGPNNLLATDNPISDQLVVAGNATGNTSVFVRNISGPGALTDTNQNGVVDNNEGILFAQIQGTAAAGLFTLGAPVTSGAFTYELVAFDPTQSQSGEWDFVLANRFSESTESYETYPRAVLFNMPTLHQRVGNRKWKGASETIPQEIFCKNPDTGYRCTLTPEQIAYFEDVDIIEEDGSWVRVYGSRQNVTPTLSTTGVTYRIDTAGIQVGHDWLLQENDDGSKWIAGLNAEIDTSYVLGNDPNGDGTMQTTALGFGGTLTYYEPNGFYTDLQARILSARTDFTASSGSYEGAEARVYSASVEVGRKFAIGDKGWHIVPQAQLVASNANFNTFTDDNGALVQPDNAESRLLRVGVSIGKEKSWVADDGTIRRLETEAGVHVYKEMADQTRVVVSGAELFNDQDDILGEITLGGTYNWHDDQNSIYGEVAVQRSLRNFGRNRRVSGTVGLRHRWE